jgi:hypothetical protein
MVKEPKKSRVNAAIRTEQETGLRLCVKCDKMLTLDHFRGKRRRHLCISHFNEIHLRDTMGTHEKRAYNSIRCKARADMIMFNQEKVFLPRTLVVKMLTEEQLENYTAYCIIPKHPDQPISKDNSIAVTSTQRKYVVAKWKTSRDPDQYERALNDVLGSEPTSK